MTSSATIPGMTRGPDFETEKWEFGRSEKVKKQSKMERPPEVNDATVQSAVSQIEKMTEMFGRKVDVQYDTNSGTVVFTVYTAEGEKIRQVPPDEAIRMAANMENNRSRYLETIF